MSRVSGVKENKHKIKHTHLADQVRVRIVTWLGPCVHWLVQGGVLSRFWIEHSGARSSNVPSKKNCPMVVLQ